MEIDLEMLKDKYKKNSKSDTLADIGLSDFTSRIFNFKKKFYSTLASELTSKDKCQTKKKRKKKTFHSAGKTLKPKLRFCFDKLFFMPHSLKSHHTLLIRIGRILFQ